MTIQSELFSIPNLLPRNKYQFFIVAHWPQGPRWKIHPEMYRTADGPELLKKVAALQGAGWVNVCVCKLPELPAHDAEQQAKEENP